MTLRFSSFFQLFQLKKTAARQQAGGLMSQLVTGSLQPTARAP